MTTEIAAVVKVLLLVLVVAFIWGIIQAFHRDHSIIGVAGILLVGGIALAAASNPQWFQTQVTKEQTGGIIQPFGIGIGGAAHSVVVAHHPALAQGR
jgi:succinate-acetate transporter protein